MLEKHVEFPFTFDEAFERYEELAELYGHLGPVSLYFNNGEFTLTHYTYDRNSESNNN